MKPKTKQALSQLIKEWDKKLKESGFKDIEDRKTQMLQHFGGDETWEPKHFDMVGHGTNARGRGYTTLVWKESQAEYYRLACQALHSEEFKNHAYRLVWQLHTEGLSADEIMQTFQKGSNLLNGTTRKTRHLIQKMAKDFGIKPFKPKKDENEV